MSTDGRVSLYAGLVLIGLLVLVALAAPWLAPYDPEASIDAAAGRYRAPGTRLAAIELSAGGWMLADEVERTDDGLLALRLGETRRLAATEVANLTADGVAASRFYLLGSDRFGRDILSRLLYGARVSLVIGLLSIVLAVTVGLALGAVAGLCGGLTDLLLMRLVEAFLAFPRLFLALALAALLEPGPGVVILILGGTGWMSIARLTRSQVLDIRRRDYVLAAQALGQHPWGIFSRHILPNAITPVLVDASLRIGDVLLLEASLSFLGLGIQPPIPSWGNMVAGGITALETAWWVTVFPGLAIALAVIGFNLLADGLHAGLDPRRRTVGSAATPVRLAAPGQATPSASG